MLLRGGRRGAVPPDGFDAEALAFEVPDTEVLGVVGATSPGDGVEMSSISADGDSDDILMCASIAYSPQFRAKLCFLFEWKRRWIEMNVIAEKAR